MTPVRRVGRAAIIALAVAAALHDPGTAAAQQLTGTALGPDGQPLSGTPVILHRVGGAGGAFVDTDTSDADGRFRFTLTADSAIHFAALRFDGRIYIGPAAQGGREVTDYVIEVAPANEAGAVASALSGSEAAPPAPRAGLPSGASARGAPEVGALVLLGLLALAAAGIFLVAAPRYRRRRTLNGLIELAAVENELAGAESGEARNRLEATRDRLRKQLAPRS